MTGRPIFGRLPVVMRWEISLLFALAWIGFAAAAV